MEETSKQLPNFSVGIDLLGHPTSSTNEAEKIHKLWVSQICTKVGFGKFWPQEFHWEQKSHQLVINNI